MTIWINPTGGNGWYWSVQDSLPGSQVWQGSTGAFVGFADPDYVAFLAAGYTATSIDTFASLCVVINSYNTTLSRSVFSSLSSGVNLSLTNPVSNFYNIAMTAGALTVTLPQMNLFGSPPIGVPFYIHPTGASNAFTIKNFGGGTLSVANANDNIAFQLLDNSTTSGTIAQIFTPVHLRDLKTGGASDAQIPIVQSDTSHALWKTISGDAALSDAGALTLASTITAGGPTGDSSHVAQITYDAKGRLTAVSSVAIDASTIGSGQALTKTDDTNVTLTLGGTPSTALLKASSLTLGWTGTLGVTRGGTGLGSFSQGDLIYGSAANTLSALSKNTSSTRYLSNTGSSNNPAWAQIDLSNGVTGTLPVANGGNAVTKLNACRIYLNSNQTGVTGSTWTKVNLDTVDYDTDSIADVSTNHRITPNVAGKFIVAASLDLVSPAANLTLSAVSIAKNGSRVSTSSLNAPSNGNDNITVKTDIISMNGTTDYFELQGLAVVASSTVTFTAGTTASHLTISWVGA